jgi:AcrR family transcriptional regulator
MEALELSPAWPFSKAKTAVLVAAAEVIREDGPRSATLKSISRRAGITEPAIFRHFDGVDGLFAGLFEVYELLFAEILKAYEAEEPGLEGYFSALDKILRIIGGNRDFAYLIPYAELVFSGYGELKGRLAGLRALGDRKVASCLAVASGELKAGAEPEMVAAASAGIIHLGLVRWLEANFSFDLVEACERSLSPLQRLITA